MILQPHAWAELITRQREAESAFRDIALMVQAQIRYYAEPAS